MQDKHISDLPKGPDPHGAEEYGSAPASSQNNKLEALQKTDPSRKGEERGTVGKLKARGTCKRRFTNHKAGTQAKGALVPFYLVLSSNLSSSAQYLFHWMERNAFSL